jgi:hypothetical protein
MENQLDKLIIGTLQVLACSIVISGVFAASADVLLTPETLWVPIETTINQLA